MGPFFFDFVHWNLRSLEMKFAEQAQPNFWFHMSDLDLRKRESESKRDGERVGIEKVREEEEREG